MDNSDVAALLRQALENVQRDYPIHWSQTLEGPDQFQPHRDLHPMFGGSSDWHSCVHQTWLIARLLRTHSGLAESSEAVAVLDRLLTAEHGQTEAAFFAQPKNARWERPYGWVWVLMLDAELRTWGTPDALRWADALAPLTKVLRDGWIRFVRTERMPYRAGWHSNTAFACGLALDAARALADGELSEAAECAALRYFKADAGYRARFEPGLGDFLSPALIEADLLRRVLSPEEFASWVVDFLPELDGDDGRTIRQPVTVRDGSDANDTHLIGLNLTRAWCWRNMAEALPKGHPYVELARTAAAAHREAGWASVYDPSYVTTHWVGSFAAYLELGALT